MRIFALYVKNLKALISYNIEKKNIYQNQLLKNHAKKVFDKIIEFLLTRKFY